MTWWKWSTKCVRGAALAPLYGAKWKLVRKARFALQTGLTSALALLVSSCLDFGDRDAKVPGEELGEYRVTARLQDSSCGPGALGSPELWQFDVRLSRDGPALFWLNGAEVIPGQIAPDGVSFSFETVVAVEAQPAEGNRPGCTVMRSDRASGQLSSPSMDVPSFAGELAYGYTPEEQSDCSELMRVPGGFSVLPCEMSYTMEGVRTATPEATQ